MYDELNEYTIPGIHDPELSDILETFAQHVLEGKYYGATYD